MSRWIDADALIFDINKSIFDADDKEWYLTLLANAPSIDIVPCKECKYEPQCRKAVEHITHELTSVTIGCNAVDYCSYGERKEP